MNYALELSNYSGSSLFSLLLYIRPPLPRLSPNYQASSADDDDSALPLSNIALFYCATYARLSLLIEQLSWTPRGTHHSRRRPSPAIRTASKDQSSLSPCDHCRLVPILGQQPPRRAAERIFSCQAAHRIVHLVSNTYILAHSLRFGLSSPGIFRSVPLLHHSPSILPHGHHQGTAFAVLRRLQPLETPLTSDGGKPSIRIRETAGVSDIFASRDHIGTGGGSWCC
jgi:hypothetical protein